MLSDDCSGQVWGGPVMSSDLCGKCNVKVEMMVLNGIFDCLCDSLDLRYWVMNLVLLAFQVYESCSM